MKMELSEEEYRKILEHVKRYFPSSDPHTERDLIDVLTDGSYQYMTFMDEDKERAIRTNCFYSDIIRALRGLKPCGNENYVKGFLKELGYNVNLF